MSKKLVWHKVLEEKRELPGIVADLEHTVGEESGKIKVNIYLEDEEAAVKFNRIFEVDEDEKSDANVSKF